SFDPIHTGHLILAERALDFAGLDRVLFIPTAKPPHKTERALSPFEQRCRMVELAIEGNERFGLSLVEGGGDSSYTWQSVMRFAADGYGRDRLYLLVGSDSLAEMAGWRRPDVIFEHATIVAMRREGTGRGAPVPAGAAVIFIETCATSISSSAIRALVAEGRSIRYLVPSAVERYIRQQRLYAARAPEAP
ncbi:MAG: nicotinate (nicotinamide) nucleotide adenylyltransferase, partial [Candidatus Krumholzibacteria bacterium]|nr:nicotinate (nicotinamide) nucleotide adenylyltransferase [Candidatus Krumholzibacteria bacterium]